MFKYESDDSGRKLIIGTVAVIVLYPWTGWCVSVLWGWFIVPVFDVVQISWLQAIGMGLVFDLFAMHRAHDDDTDEAFYRSIFNQFSKPLTFLILGWVVVWLKGWV